MNTVTAPHADELWERLLESAMTESFPPGHVLMEEGQLPDAVFFLIRGRVSISKGGVEVYQQSAGTVLGELSVLMGDRRHATATCLDDVQVLRIEGPAFLKILDQFPIFMRSIFHETVAKLLPSAQNPAPGLQSVPSMQAGVGWEKLFEAFSRRVQSTHGTCWQRIGLWGDKSCPELAKVVHCRNCPVFADAGRQLLERRPRADYLSEWSEAVSLPKQKQKTERDSVIVFRLEEEWLGLRTRIFQEITPMRPIHALPHRTNEVLLGLVNVRGELLLCFSLSNMIGVAKGEGARSANASKLIVVQNQNQRSAFPVDEILCIFELPRQELRNVPVNLAKSAGSFSLGIFECQGRQVGLLDDELLFYTLERRLA